MIGTTHVLLSVGLYLLAGLLMFMPIVSVWAGEEVVLQKELANIESELEELPARRQREVRSQIKTLRNRWRDTPQEATEQQAAIQREISQLEEELRELEKLGTRHFPGAGNKVAVFTFEDPDNTGLGDALSFVVSKRVLFHARVGSLAVVNFQQGLAPDDSGLGYFDKVDKVTRGQGYFISVWGRISRIKNGYALDTYLKFDPSRRKEEFEFSLSVPQLDGALQARVAPNRIWIQSLFLPPDVADTLIVAAREIRKLRSNPLAGASQVGQLGEGTRYWLTARDGPWIEVELTDGTRGWTSVETFCSGSCRKLFPAADFVSELMRYTSHRVWDPDVSSLTIEAKAVRDQIRIMTALKKGRKFRAAMEVAADWLKRETPTSGASFANFHALADIGAIAANGPLQTASVKNAAAYLARATLADPGNLDALHNLALLFRFAGDQQRSSLATSLYEEQAARISSRVE